MKSKHPQQHPTRIEELERQVQLLQKQLSYKDVLIEQAAGIIDELRSCFYNLPAQFSDIVGWSLARRANSLLQEVDEQRTVKQEEKEEGDK